MLKSVITLSQFSHGTLYAQFSLCDHIAASDVVIDHVDFYEYSCQTGEYEAVDTTLIECVQPYTYDSTTEHQDPAIYIAHMNTSSGAHNHLLKAVITLTTDDAASLELCCANLDNDGNITIDEFFVDTTVYEASLLNSMRLNCSDCDIPINAVNAYLKLFALRSAAETHAPTLERLFCKLSCGKTLKAATHRTKRCNCDG